MSNARIGSNGFFIRYYTEDYIAEESGKYSDFRSAIDEALCFDCETFREQEAEFGDDYLSYPSNLVAVVDASTNTIMFWANNEGKRGSDYTGKSQKYNAIIEENL